MSETANTFYELSNTLPDKERKALLEKITKSINGNTDESIIQKQMPNDEREQLIDREMREASTVERLIIRLRRLFTTRERKEIFLDRKLKALKKTIRKRSPGMSGFENYTITGRFARSVFDVYTEIYPCRGLFKALWNNLSFLENAVSYVLRQRIPDAKQTIEELLPVEEMEKVFLEKGTKENLKSIAMKRIQNYISGIKEDLFREMEIGFLPLYYLKEIALFPYEQLFDLFKYRLTDPLDKKYPDFQAANAGLVLDFIERYFYALYLATKARDNPYVHAELLFYLTENQAQFSQSAASPFVNTAGLNGIFEKIIELCGKIYEDLPLAEIIKYFRKDPYYRLMFYLPTLKIRDFYHSSLKITMMSQLDNKFLEIRKRVTSRKILEVFGNVQLDDLLNFNDDLEAVILSEGLPNFYHVKSLNLLHAFIQHIYKPDLLEILKILTRNVLIHARRVQNVFMNHSAGMEDIEEKIKIFDKSFSPESEDGKTIARMRTALPANAIHQRMYRSLVMQKNREARELLDKGLEYLNGIQRGLSDFHSPSMAGLKAQMKKVVFYNEKNVIIVQLVEFAEQKLKQFNEALKQILEIERGRV